MRDTFLKVYAEYFRVHLLSLSSTLNQQGRDVLGLALEFQYVLSRIHSEANSQHEGDKKCFPNVYAYGLK